MSQKRISKTIKQAILPLSFLAVLGAGTCLSSPVFADDDAPDFNERLTGNWAGLRDDLFEKGYNFDIYYKADAWRNLSGGVNEGNRVMDNLDVVMTVDGEKAFNSPGTTILLQLLSNAGGRINDIAGTNGGIDNIEAPTHAVKLYQAFVQQNFFDDMVSILVGLHDLNSEFYVTDSSGLFLNPTYGIGTEMAATGDNGPSIFPTTSMAARVALTPTESTYLMAAIYDGVPGDPADPRGTHVDFDDNDGALVVAEGGVRDDEIGHFGVGAWKYTAGRPDTPMLQSRIRRKVFISWPINRFMRKGIKTSAPLPELVLPPAMLNSSKAIGAAVC